MSQKNSAQNVIQSYRKRQKMGPFVVGGLAVVLVVVGILVLIVWLTGPNKPSALAFLASATPTATETSTATATLVPPTPTSTETVTLTPTITMTFTPSGPTKYEVQENDTLSGIADKFKVDLSVLLAINNFDMNTFIKVGDEITIPAPDTKLPTATPIPTTFRGEFNYIVESGDTLASIAFKFYTSEDAIIKRNRIEDQNKINAGDKLIISPYTATRAPTPKPTKTTSAENMTKTAAAKTQTSTPAPTNTQVIVPSATK